MAGLWQRTRELLRFDRRLAKLRSAVGRLVEVEVPTVCQEKVALVLAELLNDGAKIADIDLTYSPGGRQYMIRHQGKVAAFVVLNAKTRTVTVERSILV